MGKMQVSRPGVLAISTSPFAIGGCNEGERKSAPRALVMAIISGLCSWCSPAWLRDAKQRSATVVAGDRGRTTQGRGADRSGAAREGIYVRVGRRRFSRQA